MEKKSSRNSRVSTGKKLNTKIFLIQEHLLESKVKRTWVLKVYDKTAFLQSLVENGFSFLS